MLCLHRDECCPWPDGPFWMLSAGQKAEAECLERGQEARQHRLWQSAARQAEKILDAVALAVDEHRDMGRGGVVVLRCGRQLSASPVPAPRKALFVHGT